MHTQIVLADPRSSLLVTQPDTIGDPLESQGPFARKFCGYLCRRCLKTELYWRVMPTASIGWTLTTFLLRMDVVTLLCGCFGVMAGFCLGIL